MTKYIQELTMNAKIIKLGQCQYEEPFDDGNDRCQNTGRSLLLLDCFGHRIIRTLCRQHSDWVEIDEQKKDLTSSPYV